MENNPNNYYLYINPKKYLFIITGFNIGTLHTKNGNSILAEMGTNEISRIIYPDFVLADFKADHFTSKLNFGNIDYLIRIKNKFFRIFRKIISFNKKDSQK